MHGKAFAWYSWGCTLTVSSCSSGAGKSGGTSGAGMKISQSSTKLCSGSCGMNLEPLLILVTTVLSSVLQLNLAGSVTFVTSNLRPGPKFTKAVLPTSNVQALVVASCLIFCSSWLFLQCLVSTDFISLVLGLRRRNTCGALGCHSVVEENLSGLVWMSPYLASLSVQFFPPDHSTPDDRGWISICLIPLLTKYDSNSSLTKQVPLSMTIILNWECQTVLETRQ